MRIPHFIMLLLAIFCLSSILISDGGKMPVESQTQTLVERIATERYAYVNGLAEAAKLRRQERRSGRSIEALEAGYQEILSVNAALVARCDDFFTQFKGVTIIHDERSIEPLPKLGEQECHYTEARTELVSLRKTDDDVEIFAALKQVGISRERGRNVPIKGRSLWGPFSLDYYEINYFAGLPRKPYQADQEPLGKDIRKRVIFGEPIEPPKEASGNPITFKYLHAPYTAHTLMEIWVDEVLRQLKEDNLASDKTTVQRRYVREFTQGTEQRSIHFAAAFDELLAAAKK